MLRHIWRADKTRLLTIICFVFIYSWTFRVAARALVEGDDFKWLTSLNVRSWGESRSAYIFGAGTDGHYILMLLLAVFFIAILYLLIVRPDRFCRLLLLFWSAAFAAQEWTLSLRMGAGRVLRGDTMGITIPYHIIGPLEQTVMLTLAILLWLRPQTQNRHSQGSAAPAGQVLRAARIIGLLVPVTAALLFLGKQDGLTDQLGISLLYGQLVAVILLWLAQGSDDRTGQG